MVYSCSNCLYGEMDVSMQPCISCIPVSCLPYWRSRDDGSKAPNCFKTEFIMIDIMKYLYDHNDICSRCEHVDTYKCKTCSTIVTKYKPKEEE